MKSTGPIPAIDLFAGPGGLSEGFSSVRGREGQRAFEVRLSIERDFYAHRRSNCGSSETCDWGESLKPTTIMFDASKIPKTFGVVNCSRNFRTKRRAHPSEAWLAELGREDPQRVHQRLDQALGRASEWVLIGGPPCQAYSLVGRSRNRGKANYVPEQDERQTLDQEYIQWSPTICRPYS